MRLQGKYAKRVQQALKDQGYYAGEIDGLFGRNSKKALRAFQATKGLEVDGLFGSESAGKLFNEVSHQTASWIPNISECKRRYPKETRSQKQLKKFFGEPGTNLVRIDLPYPMKLSWDLDTTVTHITVNEKTKDSFIGALQEILDVYGIDKIKKLGLDLYGGAYNKRRIRGGNRWSTHAYGISIDLDPSHNSMRKKWKQARFSGAEYKDFVSIMEKHGFYSLGHSRNFDAMHFQCAW